MLDLALAMTDTAMPTVPGLGVPYPWGASAADEAFVFALWDLGRRWMDLHYADERRRLKDVVAWSDRDD